VDLQISPIGFIRSCFTEKLGTPRQSMMIQDATAVLKLEPNPEFRQALNHLEKFSHVWIVFYFHEHAEKPWKPTIRPPRLDSPRRVGVFASRSPHRPNSIGLSAVKLDRIDLDAPGGVELHLSGVDFMDGTPVLDIKPYLPYADVIAEAKAGWAEGEIPKYAVEFSEESLVTIEKHSARHARCKELITQILEWDPRPKSQRAALPIEDPETEGRSFATRVLDFDVHWKVERGGISVVHVT